VAVSEVQFTAVTQAATGTIVAAQAAGVKIRVVALFLVNTAAQTLTFKSGAGGTALTGAMALPATGILVLPFNPQGWFETAAATLLELAQSGATQVSGTIQWVAVS
jgi:predicted enzyme related to lactoylglutathione lyase